MAAGATTPAKPVSHFAKIREKHPNAYLPWNKEKDFELQELFTKGLSIAELMPVFNRTRGSIRSRLIKLGLLDKYI